MHRYRQLHKNVYSSWVNTKYFNILFLKSSTFVTSITVASKLFHILRAEGKKGVQINIKVSLQLLESL